MAVPVFDLVAALALIALAIFLAASARTSRRKYTKRPTFPVAVRVPAPTNPTDSGYQMHAVMAAEFRKKKILNISEYRVFQIVEREVVQSKRGHRVFAQTCLG